VAELGALFGVYRRMVAARIRSQFQYRLSFALNLLGSALISFLDFAAILLIFEQVDALGEWAVAEVALLYGIASVSFRFADLTLGHLDHLPTLIRQGDFDLVLLRPLGSLFQVAASDFTLRRLGQVLQGGAVLVVALTQLDVSWTLGRATTLILAIVAGVVIYAGIWVAFSTVAFWLIDSVEVANAFTYGGSFLAQYPVNIFGPWLRRLVVFIVPLAFVAYFPALFVLGKDDELGFPRAVQFASPVVALASVLVGGLVWRFAVRRYRSVGA
jgi:ABC-2 type transport system permease protein